MRDPLNGASARLCWTPLPPVRHLCSSCVLGPAPGGLTAEDRAWARSLYDSGRRAGVPLEVVHWACDDDLVAVPMDEVG